MCKTILKLMIFGFCIFFVMPAAAGWAEEYQFKGILSCSQLGPRHPEYTEASGEVLFTLDESRRELSYKLQVEKLRDAYMAHLHVGPCSAQGGLEQGPIAAWLYPCTDRNSPDRCIEGEFTGVMAEGVIRPEDLENDITFDNLIEAMRNGNAYANVHTKKYPTCEICGQIESLK